jgi:hypothetical protein
VSVAGPVAVSVMAVVLEGPLGYEALVS